MWQNNIVFTTLDLDLIANDSHMLVLRRNGFALNLCLKFQYYGEMDTNDDIYVMYANVTMKNICIY